MIQVFDDFIPKKYQDEIENVMLSRFPWYCTPDISYNPKDHDLGDQYKKRPGFFHIMANDEGIQSQYYDLMLPMVITAAEKGNINFEYVSQMRGFYQIPFSEDFIKRDKRIDPPHVDHHEDHTVILYYVKDCDGDTIIYDRKFTGIRNTVLTQEDDVGNIQKRVTPKKGRVVIFDGSLYHSAEQPYSNTRLLVNCNVR